MSTSLIRRVAKVEQYANIAHRDLSHLSDEELDYRVNVLQKSIHGEPLTDDEVAYLASLKDLPPHPDLAGLTDEQLLARVASLSAQLAAADEVML